MLGFDEDGCIAVHEDGRPVLLFNSVSGEQLHYDQLVAQASRFAFLGASLICMRAASFFWSESCALSIELLNC